jgi:acyl carrier protein
MNGGVAVDALQERVREILAVELQVAPDTVVPQASLRADLGMDSVAALNVLFAAQETFGVEEIDPLELADVLTVADVEALVRRHLEGMRV